MSLSISIELSPPSFRERIAARARRIAAWVAARMPRELPNYGRSREELGGVPWRRFEKTDAWFVGSSPGLATSAEDEAEHVFEVSVPLTLDSVPNLRSVGLSRRTWACIGGAVAVSFLLVLIGARSTPAAPPTPVASALPAAAAAPPASLGSAAAVAKAPGPAHPTQALFSVSAREKKHVRPVKRHPAKAHRIRRLALPARNHLMCRAALAK